MGEPARDTPALPSGTITFLFTDVEGSTRAWLRNAQTMGAALARHDALIEQIVAEHDGQVVRPRGEGDSRFAVFIRASDGVLPLARFNWHYCKNPGPCRSRCARASPYTRAKPIFAWAITTALR
jgi:class 3 adenylate cyclase